MNSRVKLSLSSFVLASLAVVPSGYADDETAPKKSGELEEIFITGGKETIKTTAGSAHLLDDIELEKFEYTDINRLIANVPGVYFRAEDGFGLRPNIGMRGAPAERSEKIVLMEDGILVAPAPYSAPAAYYFPNVARMSAVEVSKGPVAIKYGPSTGGGALNFVTTDYPDDGIGELNLSYGSDEYRKLHVNAGQREENYAFLLEGLTYGSDGFKELPTGDTGFERNDINAKLRFNTDDDADIYQRLDIKIGFANEHSNETYLGLTDSDFDDDPYRRYRASQLDNMDTEHKQLHLTHLMAFESGVELTTRAYRNEYERAWEKFEDFHIDRFANGKPIPGSRLTAPFSIKEVLESPTGTDESDYYALLTGETDSTGSDVQLLDVTTNGREYVSQGIEFQLSRQYLLSDWEHNVDWGFRFHNDYVERNHTVAAYHMTNGLLIEDSSQRRTVLSNKGEVDALSTYVQDKIIFNDWTITAGVRIEQIDTDFKNDEIHIEGDQDVWIPAFGVFYQYTENLGFLVGVNKGFTPNAPNENAVDVDPEESTNYEYGLRYFQDNWNVELIGFFNFYDNLVGRCRASDSNCDVSDEFNGGEVEVAGFEFGSHYDYQWGEWNVPVGLTYTYTESAFRSNFISDFSQWGAVIKGDELPYLPEHQARLEFGLSRHDLEFLAGIRYNSEMRETAEITSTPSDDFTDKVTVVDLSASYYSSEDLKLQLTVDNVFDDESIVSRRPFGARPSKPRTVILSTKYRF